MVADGLVWKKFHTGFPKFWGNCSGRRTGHLWRLHKESIYQGFVSLGYCNSFSIVKFLVGSSPKKKKILLVVHQKKNFLLVVHQKNKNFLLVDYPGVVFLLKSSSKTFQSSPNSCVLLLLWIEVIYLCFFFFLSMVVSI